MTENNVVENNYNFYDDNKTHEFITSLKSDNCNMPYRFQKTKYCVYFYLKAGVPIMLTFFFWEK